MRVLRSSLGHIFFIALFSSAGHANAAKNTIEEMVVVGNPSKDDTTIIAPDARALLNTAGEVNDPLKAILAFPSVSFAGGDFEAPVIRGGGPEDNLFLVDNIPIRSILHELSDSIISDRVLHTFDIFASVPPSQFGSGTGGVVDIRLRDPLVKEKTALLDLGQFKSGFLVEGQFSDSLSGYLSFRENLARVFLTNFEEEDDFVVNKLPTSRDYTSKIKWRGETADITATLIGSFDEVEEQQLPDTGFPASTFDTLETNEFNANALQFDKHFANGGDLSITGAVVFNQFELHESGVREQLDIDTTSLRSVFSRKFDGINAEFGFNYQSDDATLVANDRSGGNDNFDTFESFVNGEFLLGGALVDIGLILSHDGFFDETRLDPRIGANWTITENFDVFSRLGVSRQRPPITDLIALSEEAKKLQLQSTRQATLGQIWDADGRWRLQTEIYYKEFDSLAFLSGTEPSGVEGQAYGLDVFIVKPSVDGFSGFFALNLSENTRRLPDTGEEFNFKYSMPVSMTLSVNYAFLNGWQLGAKYRFQTGQPFTPVEQVIPGMDTNPTLVFGAINSERSEDYNRLDVRLAKDFSFSFAEANFYIDVLNLTDEENLSNDISEVMIDNQGNIVTQRGDAGVPLFIALGLRLKF